MTTKRERNLRNNGYRFSGFYTSESKQVAKDAAARYRQQGYFATVVTKIYHGRVYDTEGYSVYIKEKPKAGA